MSHKEATTRDHVTSVCTHDGSPSPTKQFGTLPRQHNVQGGRSVKLFSPHDTLHRRATSIKKEKRGIKKLETENGRFERMMIESSNANFAVE